MNKTILGLFIATMIGFSIVAIGIVQAQTPSIIINTPVNGATWDRNTNHSISWTAQNLPAEAEYVRVIESNGSNSILSYPVNNGQVSLPNAITSSAIKNYIPVGDTSIYLSVRDASGLPLSPPINSLSVLIHFTDGSPVGGTGDEIGWQNPPAGTPPECNDVNKVGCYPPINASTRNQTKPASLTLDGLTSIFGISISNNQPYTKADSLSLGVNGDVGATRYCNLDGSICKTITEMTGGGVSKIIAGANITISPVTGTGEVTISSTGGPGGADGFGIVEVQEYAN